MHSRQCTHPTSCLWTDCSVDRVVVLMTQFTWLSRPCRRVGCGDVVDVFRQVLTNSDWFHRRARLPHWLQGQSILLKLSSLLVVWGLGLLRWVSSRRRASWNSPASLDQLTKALMDLWSQTRLRSWISRSTAKLVRLEQRQCSRGIWSLR